MSELCPYMLLGVAVLMGGVGGSAEGTAAGVARGNALPLGEHTTLPPRRVKCSVLLFICAAFVSAGKE